MKINIKNRKGQKMVVLIDIKKEQKGLAFVMHGLGGFKEQPHIQVMADAFLQNGFTVVRFDTTNTYGESDGNYEDATVTNYYEDLEDIITWSRTKPWYREPFCLAGHSLGAMCVALYAEKYSEKVSALAPIGIVVSGALSLDVESNRDWREWKKTGWRIRQSESKPGTVKRLKWSHMLDRLKYDLRPNIGKLTMPVLMIVGGLDDSTPVIHQQIFYSALNTRKELHIIKGAPHTFRVPEHLSQLRELFNHWLRNL